MWCCHSDALSEEEHAQAEKELCDAGLHWFNSRDPSRPPVKCLSSNVIVPSLAPGLHIHTLEYIPSPPLPSSLPAAPPLVCLHGFGFGAALFYTSLPALAERWGGRVFAIDTLGCALSSRPRWPLPRGARCDVGAAEEYLISAIEAWRHAMALDAMVL